MSFQTKTLGERVKKTYIVDAEGKFIARMIYSHFTIEEQEKTSRLLAAAQDAIEALKEIRESLANGVGAHQCAGWDCATCGKSHLIGLADDVLEKAEGRNE